MQSSAVIITARGGGGVGGGGGGGPSFSPVMMISRSRGVSMVPFKPFSKVCQASSLLKIKCIVCR